MLPRLKSATYRALSLIGSCVLCFTACSTPEDLIPGSSELRSSGGSAGAGGSSGGAASGGANATGGVTTGGLPSTGGTPITGGAPQTGGSGSGGDDTGGAPTGGTAGAGGSGGSTGGAGGAGGSTGGTGGSTGGAGGSTGGTGGTGGTPPVGFVYKSVPDSKCRDGSPAGYFIKEGAASKNLMIFLEGGGGVCFDSFLCGVAPKNVNESVDGETLLQMALKQQKQQPPNEGIFKDDARNPVRDWNMIYVPYCTGDVHAGTKANGTIAGLSAPQQFVGYTNFGTFLAEFAPKFQDAQKVLLAGSSGGSYGALINADRTMPAFPNSTLYVVSDSGVPFDDLYLEPCLQKIWRDLWGLNGAFPTGCTGCFQADGGGIAKGLSKYLYDKYQGRVLGGFVSSNQDDVVKGFYGKGLSNCQASIFYPADRFPNGLHNLRDTLTDKARTSSYFLNMINHVHLYRARYYQDNGLGMSIAAWLDKTLQGQSVHLGE